MGARRRGREHALQMLYQADAGGATIEDAARQFWAERETPEDVRAFADLLARGTWARLGEIDHLLSACLENWRLERLAIVDRNILRLAVFEMLGGSGTPAVVAIDEAIEVARRFGGDDSWQFVNGILDAVRKRLEADPPPPRDGTPAGTPPAS